MANLTVSADIDAFMGSADKAAGRSNLGAAASGPNTDITSVTLTSGTIVGPPSGDNAIVNKAYADSISSGINFHDACLYATTAALPAYTYDNGPLNDGVGASITATVTGPFSPDGVAIAVTVPAQRILVKNETLTKAPYNGIYTVERAGGASETFKLVRATDYDTSGSGTNEIQAGDFILISGGDTLRNTAWIQQSELPIDVGVDPLSFVQFSAPISGVVSVNQGGTGQQSFTNGQLLIGNTTGNTLAKATLTAGTGMTVTNGSGAITLTAKGLGTQVKVVGVDGDGTIQSCIDLCTGASSTNPFTVLIPPKAGNYVEHLTLKGSVALIGLTNALNSDAIQIEGSHTYAPDLASGNSNRIGFENLTFISALLTANTISVVAGTGGTKYASQLRFSGCVFSGGKNSGVSHISTCDNVSLYIDNCRFESTTGNAGSAGITQGNGPLYLSNNTVFDVFGKALDIPASTTVTKTATSTFGSYTLTVSDVTGLSVGQKISGTGLYSTTTVVSITAPSTVVMSTPPQTATAGFTATFGQTPYVEIHDAVLIGKGAEVVRLGNGLLTCNTSNFTNYASGGNGINMLTANTVIGMVNSSFSIYDATAYTITAAAATCYAALNGISYSSSLLGAYSTLIGANVAPLDYSARATSVANGGTGQTTYTNGQLLIGNTTGNTLSKATLTAGTGITVTNGTGTITLATSGAGNATNLQGGNNTTLLGSVPYQSNTNVTTLLAPNTTTTKKFLRQTGTGTNGAAPAWDTLVAGDVPTLNQNTTGTAANVTGTVAVANGGTGATDAATARTNLSAATFADVQIFTGNGTWTKPTGAKSVTIQLFGAGGGGGGARKDTGSLTSRSGGGGGAGGSYLSINVPATALASTETITIGAGGAGGAGSTITGSGTAGTKGGDTIFKAFTATGGGFGAAGGGSAAGGGGAVLSANGGGQSSITATAANGAPNTATSVTLYGGSGGGGGGGTSIADAPFAGGDGGRAQVLSQAGGAGGAATGANGSAGYTNPDASTGIFAVGSGGGGGGAGTTTSGGTGGAGGFPACGGGGGGATISGTTSGAGGAGANGLAIITTYF